MWGRGKRRLLGVALGVTLALAATEGRAALDPKSFLQSPGAEAFRAGEFEAALEGFRALEAAHPDDPLVLRYLAITLDRLDRHEEALDTLERALALDPDNPALHYFLGVSAWKAGQGERAAAGFRRALALAPDSAYAEKAETYLAAIGRQTAANRPTGAPRAWNLEVSGGLQYDDNVPAGPDGGEDGDLRGFEAVNGDVVVAEIGGLRLKGLGFAYFSQHTESANQDFDVMLFEPGVEISYAFDAFGLPTLAAVRYAYEFVLTQGDPFSSTHEVTSSVTVRAHDQALTRFHHRLSLEEFKDDGVDPTFSSRDGIDNAWGVTQYVFCCNQQHYLFGGYEFRLKNADGANFDLHGHKLVAGASAGLPYGARLELFGEYAAEDHGNFISTRSRQTHRTSVSAVLKKDVVEGLTAGLTYAFTDENSNYATLEFDRHVVGATFGYRF